MPQALLAEVVGWPASLHHERKLARSPCAVTPVSPAAASTRAGDECGSALPVDGLGNTTGPELSARASARTSTARLFNGTLWMALVLVRVSGITQTATSRSNSLQAAPRTSPARPR